MAKALAFLTGLALFFGVILTVGFLRGDDTPLLLPLLVAAYGVSAVIFGFFWPEVGWRFGLWLFTVWPPMLLFAAFLGGEALMEGHVDMKGMIRDLAGYSIILVGACLSAEIGAIIKRRRMVGASFKG